MACSRIAHTHFARRLQRPSTAGPSLDAAGGKVRGVHYRRIGPRPGNSRRHAARHHFRHERIGRNARDGSARRNDAAPGGGGHPDAPQHGSLLARRKPHVPAEHIAGTRHAAKASIRQKLGFLRHSLAHLNRVGYFREVAEFNGILQLAAGHNTSILAYVNHAVDPETRVKIARLGGFRERVPFRRKVKRAEDHDLGVAANARTMEEVRIHLVKTNRAALLDLISARCKIVLGAARVHHERMAVARLVAHVDEGVAAAKQLACLRTRSLDLGIHDDVARLKQSAHAHHFRFVLRAVGIETPVVFEHCRFLRTSREQYRQGSVGRA